ncbi:tetratricopeptide repeat protein [Asticcacaulis sp. YBE204]|uniref:tetratricopeptide repeat protein n=1 Tax=Asticcacaulis sp. YBE204 TaxID=1282363 RepID=UPI0003C3D5E5|nr:tetratricopeptide repeat protein [Asticcacaulis sp. YBE204]ESQ78367.1 hypothetical protein AEYBE204_14440 [Asticcacaulis sp. YBE204]
MGSSNRIDGWKAIGGHFGRDRTTVMRWAQQRGLPVRRLPGGKTGTVYALKDELDRWAASQTNLNEEAPETEIAPPPVPEKPGFWARNWRRLAVVGLMLLGLGFAAGNIITSQPRRTPPSPALPSDPAVSALYLQARDEWAQRTPASLARAIGLFTTITTKEPGFAPAWAGLADAYLLSREFGITPDAEAFPKARAAAEAALDRDPGLGAAHRALGFIAYWWEDDPQKAGRSFRKALALAPRDAQTHFWYGNILSDNGQHVAALRELNTARLIEPGSVAIQTDLAWAQWSAGDDASARQALNQLMQVRADFPVVHDCTSLIKLADGDYVGYVQDLGEFARLRGDSALIAHATALRGDLKTGAAAVQKRLMSYALGDVAAKTRRTHVWPVFLASVAQDRQQVVALLKTADARNESWGEAGLTARIARLWMDDVEIGALLRQRKAPPVE